MAAARDTDIPHNHSAGADDRETNTCRSSDGPKKSMDENGQTLLYIGDKIRVVAFSIILVEICQYFVFYRSGGSLHKYLQDHFLPLHSGSFRSRSQLTSGISNVVAYTLPIIGALIADAKWCPHKTIPLFFFAGLLAVGLPPFYSSFQARAQFSGWIVGAIVVATGTGRRVEGGRIPIVDVGIHRYVSSIYPRNMKDAFERGFRKYPNSAFGVHVFPFGKVTVLTNRKLIDEMNHAPSDDLSFDEVSQMLIQPDHTTFGQAPQHHPIVVMQQNFNRRLGLLLSDISDDIKAAVDDALEHTAGGWCSVVAHNLAETVTSRIALCAVVGRPLCESPEVANLVFTFATKATKSAFWINMFPRALHFIVGPLISSASLHRKRLAAAIMPIVDNRRQKLETLGCDWNDKPNDYLMCLIESAPPGQNYESSYEGIAERLLQFSFASFHTSGNALSNLLLDLAACPSYADALRDEMNGIVDYEGMTKQSMQKMRLTDSFMTESARLNPIGISVDRSCSIGLTSLTRFARHSYTFSERNVVLPKGTIVMASMNTFHRDENTYPQPDVFDPWRFSNMKQPSEVVKSQYTTITPHYMYFGHGKRACPGRFFAEMELKTILYYIVTKYDLKMKDGVRAPDDELGIGVLPSKSAKIMIRRRATFRAEELT